MHPSTVLVLLACAVLLAIAYQAQAGVRSHRATVERVLSGYGATAAWNFDHRLAGSGRASDLGEVLEGIFHPVHNPPPGPLPPAAAILHPRGIEMEHFPWKRFGPVTFALRFPRRGGDGDAAGAPPPGVPLAAVREVVRRHAGDRPLRRTEGAVGAELGGRPFLIGYSAQTQGADTLLYAVVLDPALLAPFLRVVFTEGELLPAPLVGTRPNGELLTVRLAAPGGGTLFASGADDEGGPAVTHGMDSAIPGVALVVGLRQQTARRLIIGGPNAASLPLMGVLLALAAGLLATGLAQMRREQALARLRNDFVANVSHELRTPLALQRVFLDMLRLGRTHTREQQRWAIDNVDRESLRLAHLVENVLRFSRAEQGQMRITPEWGELSRIVREGAETFAPLATPAGARLEMRIEDGIHARVDAAAYRQVLLNLLENAVKYGPEGQTITVALALEDGAAVLAVDDEGPGIPRHERDAVFEPFRRGEAVRESSVAGSGIGLAVVRQIVRQHGGSVAVEDAPSGGARLRVALPGARRSPAARGDAGLRPGAVPPQPLAGEAARHG